MPTRFVMLRGCTVMTGGAGSRTVTVKPQLADFPQSFVAEQVTRLAPTENSEPEAGTQTMAMEPPQQPDAADAVNVTVASHWFGAAVTRRLPGHVTLGNDVSCRRNGTKSIVPPTTASPSPPGLLAWVGPVDEPHQLFSMLMVSVPV